MITGGTNRRSASGWKVALIFCLIVLPMSARSQSGLDEASASSSTGVSAGLDSDTTSELHDNNTVLRDVSTRAQDRDGVVLHDALRIWVGGAIQYDYHSFDGIYNHESDGKRERGGVMRRMEVVLRTTLYDWGETKFQYDVNDGTARDVYLRWVSKIKPVTVTLGNQKEPMGMDFLMGNKITLPQERGTPAYAFGGWRSLGLRLHRAFEMAPDKKKLHVWAPDDSPYITTSIGIFTKDMEEAHKTDLAVTGRVTSGRYREGIGMHVGLSASYREGEFDRISLRPELRSADRINLATPQANTLGVVAIEGAYARGPVSLQAEAYGANYGGRVDGDGVGAYLQASWSITGENRNYQTKWGTFGPVKPNNGRYATQIFTRVSASRGEDDVNGWNGFKSLTIGGSVVYHSLRASMNLLYGNSRELVSNEDDGLALNIRLQYLM